MHVQSLGWEESLENRMAIHSRILAWRIPWREEPGRLQSMGLWRVGHDWATGLNWTEIIWEAKYYSMVAQWLKHLPAIQETCVQSLGWQPNPVFLPGESHGERSLVGYSPWDHKELDLIFYSIFPPFKVSFLLRQKGKHSQVYSVLGKSKYSNIR